MSKIFICLLFLSWLLPLPYHGIVVVNGDVIEWWRIFTYSFEHIRNSHFIYNMLYLIPLTLYYEMHYSRRQATLLWVFPALLGGVAFILLENGTRVTHGASAIVFAFMGACLADYKRLPLLLKLLIPVLTIGWFYQTFTAISVNEVAHIVGFFTGISIHILIKEEKYEIVFTKRCCFL